MSEPTRKSIPDSFVTSRKRPWPARRTPPGPSSLRTRSTNRVEELARAAGTGQVLAAKTAVGLVIRKLLRGLSIPRVVHSVERQRLDRLAGDRVLVRVLVPAVEDEDVV